ncbi:MAG: NERD domain-containing protein [Eubacteriales bacterium]|nr:NERD domain-containing protein [Eubacteriales bacterium]
MNYKKTIGSIIFHNPMTGIDKGMFGEFKIITRLRGFSPYNYYVSNCYVPKPDGTTSEIDTVMVHETGVYVFESKNYTGYIFGSEINKSWTVTHYAGAGKVNKYQFYNPIMQNKMHMEYLRNYLKTDAPMFSYIVFHENCTFKDINYDTSKVCVCKYDELSRKIGIDINHRKNVLSQEQMKLLFGEIDQLAHKSAVEKIRHIQAIHEKKQQVNNHICPNCGNALVIRTAKSGPNTGNQFYGCSNYPKCRFTSKKF